MAKTIAQLKKEIATQRLKIRKQSNLSNVVLEKQKLSRELFKLKNQQLISAGAKAKRLSAKFGRGILKVGQKVAPVIQKQAKLIRDQQLRDDAIARARAKIKTRSPTMTKSVTRLVPIKRKGKRTLFKKVTSKVKTPRPVTQKSSGSSGIFGNLDF